MFNIHLQVSTYRVCFSGSGFLTHEGLIKMTSNDILLYPGQCLDQPASEKFPPVSDESKYKDPQSDVTHRERVSSGNTQP